MTIDDYLNLVTSEHRDKPNFISMVSLDVSLPVRVQNLFMQMIPRFSPFLAVGQQLDVIGQWVGISRNVSIPVEGVYFTWDGSNFSLGWDYAIWEDQLQPALITVLNDGSYRVLILSKIAANKWDGTTEGIYDILGALFLTVTVLVDDHQDMSYSVGIVGDVINSLTIALITGGYIPLKPEGVRVRNYFFAVNTGPFFGWDLDSPYVKGWDTGSWAREIDPS